MPVVSLIFFHPWSADLTPVAKDIVDQTAAKIKDTKPSTVTIAGYTYHDGPARDDMVLATQRVDTVRKALIADGIDPGLFLDIPIGPATDDAGKTGDRRIEIRLQYGH
jgi:outer membrane protein OmpA-like peptidoglycan-associated protein